MKAILSFLILSMALLNTEPAPEPNVQLMNLESNSLVSLPISALHPSQGRIGKADVAKRVEKLLSRMDRTPPSALPALLAKHQAQLDHLELPCTVMPDGYCWVSDGHHRTSAFAWIEFFKEIHGTFKIPMRIVDNYSGLTWFEAVSRLIENNRVYLSPDARQKYRDLRDSASSPDEHLLELKNLIEAEIPREFTQISDDPLRAAVGDVLGWLLKGIPTIDFIEFYVGEMIQTKLFHHHGGDPGRLTQRCTAQGFETYCAQLKSKGLKTVAQLILNDPAVIAKIRDSILDGDCVTEDGLSQSCRELFQSRLKLVRTGKSSSYHLESTSAHN